ncbi:translation initiation factor IF-2 isoform X5 [Pteropus medius]|nr:translation initiation factor IF-2 isoform X5 [Pteropus giganteus]
MTCTGSLAPGLETARGGVRPGEVPGGGKGSQAPTAGILSPRPPPGGALRPPATAGLTTRAVARSGDERPLRGEAARPACREAGTRGLGGDPGLCRRAAGRRPEGALRGRAGAARRKCRLRRRLSRAAGPPQPRGPRCRPGPGATTRGPGPRDGRGSRRSRSCSGAGSRSGGGKTRSSCSSSSTWSP